MWACLLAPAVMLCLLLVLSTVEDWLAGSPVTAGPRDPEPRVTRLTLTRKKPRGQPVPLVAHQPAMDREAA